MRPTTTAVAPVTAAAATTVQSRAASTRSALVPRPDRPFPRLFGARQLVRESEHDRVVAPLELPDAATFERVDERQRPMLPVPLAIEAGRLAAGDRPQLLERQLVLLGPDRDQLRQMPLIREVVEERRRHRTSLSARVSSSRRTGPLGAGRDAGASSTSHRARPRATIAGTLPGRADAANNARASRRLGTDSTSAESVAISRRSSLARVRHAAVAAASSAASCSSFRRTRRTCRRATARIVDRTLP